MWLRMVSGAGTTKTALENLSPNKLFGVAQIERTRAAAAHIKRTYTLIMFSPMSFDNLLSLARCWHALNSMFHYIHSIICSAFHSAIARHIRVWGFPPNSTLRSHCALPHILFHIPSTVCAPSIQSRHACVI